MKAGTDLHVQRPFADEVAIVANGLSKIAAKGHSPQLVATVDTKCKGIAKEARRLAKALRKKDAEGARTAHSATAGLVRRLTNELPRPKTGEDGEDG